MDPLEKLVDPEAMHQWVMALRKFLEESSPPQEYPSRKQRRPSDESLARSESSETDLTRLVHFKVRFTCRAMIYVIR